MISLGIDAGGSSTKWLLLSEEAKLASGKSESFSGLNFAEARAKANLKAIKSLAVEVLQHAQPQVIVAGVTGYSEGFDNKLKDILSKSFNLSQEKILLKNDMYIAYRNAFSVAEGVLVYAGTGSISYYLDENRILRAGGRGYLIDDAGGGYWIGRQALKAVLREEDKTGKPAMTELAQQIYTELGSKDWQTIKATVYAGGRKKLASLSPAVSRAALEGDAVAVEILESAGLELARLANVLLNRLGGKKAVAFAGGISKASDILTASLRASLIDNSGFKVIKREAVEAAARIGLELIQN